MTVGNLSYFSLPIASGELTVDEIRELKEAFERDYPSYMITIPHQTRYEYIPQPRDPLVTGILTQEYKIHPNIWAAYQTGLCTTDVSILLTKLVELGGIDAEGNLLPAKPLKMEEKIATTDNTGAWDNLLNHQYSFICGCISSGPICCGSMMADPIYDPISPSQSPVQGVPQLPKELQPEEKAGQPGDMSLPRGGWF